MSNTLTKIKITAPKNSQGTDLSDHYPIQFGVDNLKIVSYNLQFMYSLIGVQGKKSEQQIQGAAKEFADYFTSVNADICLVQELFDSKANEAMQREMDTAGYVATNLVSRNKNPILHGGVRFFIKKELADDSLKTYQHVYKNNIDYFSGDALISKGVTQLTFTKNEKKYHFFNTHLQAYYPNRDHYAEITLAQCVELKKFIAQQEKAGIISADDEVILAGDFNIPKSNSPQEETFLFRKMARILGPRFTFADFDKQEGTPKYTRAVSNSYNTEEKGNDINVDLDMAIQYKPHRRDVQEKSDEEELAFLFGEIQLSLVAFVKSRATLFSLWTLSNKAAKTLDELNEQFKQLILKSDTLLADGKKEKKDVDNLIKEANQFLKDCKSKNKARNFKYTFVIGIGLASFAYGFLPAFIVLVAVFQLKNIIFHHSSAETPSLHRKMQEPVSNENVSAPDLTQEDAADELDLPMAPRVRSKSCDLRFFQPHNTEKENPSPLLTRRPSMK